MCFNKPAGHKKSDFDNLLTLPAAAFLIPNTQALPHVGIYILTHFFFSFSGKHSIPIKERENLPSGLHQWWSRTLNSILVVEKTNKQTLNQELWGKWNKINDVSLPFKLYVHPPMPLWLLSERNLIPSKALLTRTPLSVVLSCLKFLCQL